MKRIFVIALSIMYVSALAQTSTQTQTTTTTSVSKTAPTADNNSLDGRSFKITLKTRAEDQTKVNSTTRTSVNSEQQVTPSGEPMYGTNRTGVNTTTGTVNTQTQTGTTGVNTTTGTQPEGTVSGTQTQTQTGSTTGGDYNKSNTGTTNTQTTVSGNNYDGRTAVQSGNVSTQTNTMAGANRTGVNVTNETTTVTSMENHTMVISFRDGMLMSDDMPGHMTGNVHASDPATGTTAEVMQTAGTGCPYNVTSGSGGLSTFSASCSDYNGMGKAFWNGFVNEGTISGNMIVYGQNGNTMRYTFSGKSVKNSMKKATSQR